MDASNDSDARFFRLVEGERPREAFVLFLEAVEDKGWPDLAASDLRALDVVCQRLMPELLERHTLWMVSRPGRLRQMLQLLTRALEVNYRPPATLDQIAWLRCLLAISEAMVGRPERVHEELCLTCPEASAESGPPLNGTFRRQIQDLEPNEGAAAAFLQPFFEAYVGFLRRTGRHELANHVESRVLKLVGLIARDESRPGVVQALLFVQGGRGHARFIHVSLERRPPTEEERTSEETIIYARREVDRIDAVMQESAAWARVAADAYLKRAGYPDGLREQVVYWEIGTLRGDAADLPQQYEGGSAAMPLAVAIVSGYLDQPVPNDIAMTGAFTAVGAEEGHVRPVDGLPEKIQHALHSGSRVVYVPSGNAAELDGRPALKDLVAEHDARVVPVETVDEVCQELFPPEGSGRLQDALKDAGRNVLEMVGLAGPREGTPPPVPVHRHHRVFTLGCGLLVAASVFLEGWMVHKGFAPAYPSAEAWTRIGAASVIVLAGMWACFALPAACMRHRKTWSWFAGIGLLTGCYVAAWVLLGTMLPASTSVSRVYNAPPAAGLMKDLFLMWLFAWGLAVNSCNVVAALERLVGRRQFVTARDCLRWNASWEVRMPIRCVAFPWKWAAVGLGGFVVVLISWELRYYGSLYPGRAADWLTFLGLGRDLLFIGAITTVMVFYKTALAGVRGALS